MAKRQGTGERERGRPHDLGFIEQVAAEIHRIDGDVAALLKSLKDEGFAGVLKVDAGSTIVTSLRTLSSWADKVRSAYKDYRLETGPLAPRSRKQKNKAANT